MWRVAHHWPHTAPLPHTWMMLRTALRAACYYPSTILFRSFSKQHLAFLNAATQSRARPDIADVNRISHGKGARRRGTGSRSVPHRLDAEAQKMFKLGKKRGFIVVSNAGRCRIALQNVWRLYCDALAQPAIVLLTTRSQSKQPADALVLDLSPLRAERASALAEVALSHFPGGHCANLSALDSPCLKADNLTQPIWALEPDNVYWCGHAAALKKVARDIAFFCGAGSRGQYCDRTDAF